MRNFSFLFALVLAFVRCMNSHQIDQDDEESHALAEGRRETVSSFAERPFSEQQ